MVNWLYCNHSADAQEKEEKNSQKKKKPARDKKIGVNRRLICS